MQQQLRARDCYYLYELKEDGFKKLGRAQNPAEFEEKFKVNEKCLCKMYKFCVLY